MDKMNMSANQVNNDNSISEKYTALQKLNEKEKKKLQVKDGQHNHHVDERGGAN